MRAITARPARRRARAGSGCRCRTTARCRGCWRRRRVERRHQPRWLSSRLSSFFLSTPTTSSSCVSAGLELGPVVARPARSAAVDEGRGGDQQVWIAVAARDAAPGSSMSPSCISVDDVLVAVVEDPGDPLEVGRAASLSCRRRARRWCARAGSAPSRAPGTPRACPASQVGHACRATSASWSVSISLGGRGQAGEGLDDVVRRDGALSGISLPSVELAGAGRLEGEVHRAEQRLDLDRGAGLGAEVDAVVDLEGDPDVVAVELDLLDLADRTPAMRTSSLALRPPASVNAAW